MNLKLQIHFWSSDVNFLLRNSCLIHNIDNKENSNAEQHNENSLIT